MTLATKLRTFAALGLGNVARVAAYRIGLATGLHPVQRIRSEAPTGPFLQAAPAKLVEGLVARTTWQNGSALYFGRSHHLESEPPHWFSSPWSSGGEASSTRPWWQIADFDPTVGDIKPVWEASRFDWLIAMAQRAALGDASELARLNIWLQDWSAKNKPYLGANWKCAQEASIRVMHLALASMILGQHRQSAPALLDLVRLHLARIAPTMDYATGQANNHGTSEAAALLIGGSWLAAHGDARGRRWAARGRKALEERAAALIERDGTFSQYSVNYHRLMLDTYSFAEIWRRSLGLPPFSVHLTGRLNAATTWLRQLVDTQTGEAPNLGANDGARLLALTDTDYRDFRPSVQLASLVFLGMRAIGQHGSWDQPALWLGLDDPNEAAPALQSTSFDDGGLHVLRQGRAVAYLRYPRFRFRPSQADALHLDLWLDGNNLLRDAGTYSYNESAQTTAYFNGTKAHNTIEFDNRDQMPRLGRFLFGDWLRTRAVTPVRIQGDDVEAMAAYEDSWHCRHQRTVRLSTDQCVVDDAFSGFGQQAVLRWRLAPGEWTLSGRDLHGNGITISISPSAAIADIALVGGEESRYYLEKSALPVLEVRMAKPGSVTTRIIF
jgi:hypothetical protein